MENLSTTLPATTAAISNTDDLIDIENVIARYEELEEKEFDKTEEEKEEFLAMEGLLEACKGNGGDEQWKGDWYPATLIRDSHFERAMDEMIEDIGDLPKNIPCYLKIEVDYDALQSDYTSIEFDGVTYWCR